MADPPEAIETVFQPTLWHPATADAADFHAVLLQYALVPLPADSPSTPPLPAKGSRVAVGFGPEGFTLGLPGAPGISVLLAPTAHLNHESVEHETSDMANDEDPRLVRIAGTFPVWSLSLYFDDAVTARRFRQQSASISLSVVSRMHSLSPTDGAMSSEGTLFWAGYVFRSSVEDPEGVVVTSLAENRLPRYQLWWMELRPHSRVQGWVAVSFYNHSGAGASLMDVSAWGKSNAPDCLMEWKQHVLVHADAEPRGGRYANEPKMMTVITFRSAAEAEVVADLAVAAEFGDDALMDDARQRLEHQRQQEVSDRSAAALDVLQCFTHNVRDAVYRPASVPDPVAQRHRRLQVQERARIRGAIEACRRQDFGHSVASDTVQVISESSSTMQIIPCDGTVETV